MRTELAPIFTRIETGIEAFIAYAIEHAALTRPQALVALAAYRKARVIKIDSAIGSYRVTHGAFLDAVTLRRAAGVLS